MAAKQTVNVGAQCARIIQEVRGGVFKPVYLLMGDEPYYPDLVCNEIIANCVDESFKDFNETICYGPDVTVDQVITAARRFPMMADRQLVVVKEAQLLKDIDNLSFYTADPLDTTVLVVLMHKASIDKRKSFYKAVCNIGEVVDSPSIRDYEIASWITDYYLSRGLKIDPQAAALLSESTGTDLSTIAVETDKLLKNLKEGVKKVSVEDIERNVGISRQYSIFELTRELSYRRADKALAIAGHIGTSAKFAMPMAVSALFTHFYRILKYDVLLQKNNYPPTDQKSKVLGVNPYFFREYDAAAKNYPLKKAMAAVSLLNEYDYLGKGGDGGEKDPSELLVELVVKILNL
ncbi:MAG: DNA polymerase III subunit delta [Bacteroidales bacterium]|nr:DNA polymerase III subunit delta [Bacteroidales bacterium]